MPRLSLTPQPVMSSDVTGGTIYYADWTSVLCSAIVPVSVGAYDVFVTGGIMHFAPFNSARPMANYVGSINVSVAGQLTCNFSLDCNRKFEVYNAYHQRSLLLRVITQERDMTYSPKNSSYLPFDNNPLNCGTIITGLPEAVEVIYYQAGYIDSLSGPYALLNAVGWNGNPAGPGGGGTHDDSNTAAGVRMLALYSDPAVIGVNVATMLVAARVYTNNDLSRIDSAPSTPPMDGDGVMYIKWNG